MAKRIVRETQVLLTALPEGHPSSLQVIDREFEDGTIDRLWLKDDVVGRWGMAGRVVAIQQS